MTLRTVVDWVVTIAAAAVFVLAFEAEVAKPYRVPSASMEPTLHCAKPVDGCEAGMNDRVIADRITYRFRAPHRGEIVVFHAPAAAKDDCGTGGTYIKRVVGLPGETIAERDGRVYVDGRPLAEPYVDALLRDHRTDSWPRVPRDAYFLLGDDRGLSCDSRRWGPVPRSRIIGRVLVRYWPPQRVGIP